MADIMDVYISDDGVAGQIPALSPLDQIMPRVYTRLVLCLPTPPASKETDQTIFSALKKGLQQTLTEIPLLGGLLDGDNEDSDKVHITPGPGVLLRLKKLTGDPNWSYQTLKDKNFPPSSLDGDVLAPVGWMPSGLKPPVMAAQVNVLDGGVLLAVCIHHSAMDAAGFSTVVKTWAKHTMLSFDEDVLESVVPVGSSSLDRTPLCGESDVGQVDPKIKIKNHPQYKLESSAPPPPPSKLPEEPDPLPPALTLPAMTATIFHFSADQLAALKSSVNPPTSFVSTNDALCALLWSSITRARSLPNIIKGSQEPASSLLGFAVDGRHRLNPALPQSYIGNVNLYASTRLPIPTLTDPSKLSAAATAIRAAITEVDNNRIRDVIALINSLSTVTDLKPGFNSFLGPDLAITSWRDMGIMGLHWGAGLGAVEAARVPKAAFDGLCIVLPALADGGLDVLVGLQEGAMRRLGADETFSKYAEVRCS